jgi:AraC-like DNA-binding protein
MQPYLRAGVLGNFRATAQALGADADQLLAEADVAPEVMTVPGIYLPYANYMKLLDCAARATGAAHFGLEMTRTATTETLGTTGIIMTQADTVGAAWQALGDFYGLHDTYGSVRLETGQDCSIIAYSIPRKDLPGTRQIYDVAAGVSTNIMKQFCGSDYRSLGYGFPYPQPQDLSCYASLGTDQLRFDTDAVEILFDSSLLHRKIQGKSPEMRSVLDHYFATREEGAANSTSRKVEDLIRRMLPTGTCTLPMVAETLSATERTLQVRLEAEKTSFRQLLEKVRREVATYHLHRGDMQLTQLAMVLGYSELSAFSRSFRGWYGMSPRQWSASGNWSG